MTGALRLLVAAVWVGYAVSLAIALPAEADFLIYGFAGGAVVVLATHPSRRTVLALIAGACLLLALRPDPLGRALAIEPALPVAYLGLAAVIYLAIRSLRSPIPGGLLAGAIGIPMFIFLLDPVHRLIITVTPRTLDPVLHRIDVAIFGELTFGSARLLAANPWLLATSKWCYVALALVGAGVYALALRGRTGEVRPAELLCGWAVAGVLGALCYLVVPAVGPRFVFPEWPWQMPDASGTYAVPWAPVPRNAMPSLHAAWALLICWGARQGPVWVKWLLGPWLAFTFLATVGAGGHYLIDLVASLPLTWAAAWAGVRLARTPFPGLAAVPSASESAAWVPGGGARV